MAKKKPVTLQLLAKELKLSAYTVSKALRGLPGMSEETRSAVLAAAERLGYRTRDQVWNEAWEKIDRLKAKPRRFLFVTGLRAMQLSHMNRIIEEGLRERLEQMGHRLDTIELPTRTVLSEELAKRTLEEKEIVYADGLFLSFSLPDVWERNLLRQPMPKIFINFPPVGAEADSIVWDVYDAVQQSLILLLAKGHRRILYIGDITTHRGYRLRWQAFQEIAALSGLDIRADEHLTGRYHSNDAFYADFQKKWESFRPTALLCSVEDKLERVLDCCYRLDIFIPEQCSMICLDPTENERFHDIASPGILVRETGHRAADRMLWRIANAHMPYEHIRVRGKFRSGSSIGFMKESVSDPKRP